jgi:hypothetical protein
MTTPDKDQKRAAREAQALSTNELTTRTEATIRKIASVVIFGATSAAYVVKGAALINPGFWSLLLAAAFAVFMTGQRSV